MNLPQDFISQLHSYNSPVLDGLVDALCETSPEVSVRCNILKGINRPKDKECVLWCDNGFYLDNRRQFTFDPAMHQGLYYVQDASSMIISHIVKHLTLNNCTTPVRYLDACAAPGGKTTAAIDALPVGSLVVANEYNPSRASVLKENVIKWGYPSSVISRGDTARFRRIPDFFDIVAADVPCSGEGMFRKDPEAVAQWTPALVKECAARQREIIDNLWETLKPGGFLIYSTCTFNRDENEEMVQYICDNLGATTVDIDFPDNWDIAPGIDTEHHCYRFMPHKVKGEGLFVAVIHKTPGQSAGNNRKKSKGSTLAKVPQQFASVARQWIMDTDNYNLVLSDDSIIAIPKRHSQEFDIISSCLDVIGKGITIASIKGKDLIPSQSLLLSTAFNRDAFPTHEIDYTTAISYLRRETITLADAPRGYVVITYNNHPLGFVKNLGNRANNLYPQEWRILSSHIPDTPPSVI